MKPLPRSLALETPAAAPPVTNAALASALLALARAEEAGSRAAAELRDAALALRQLGNDVHGRKLNLTALPRVTRRAADTIGAFLTCGSDDAIEDEVAAVLDRPDPSAEAKRDFFTRADVERLLAPRNGVSLSDLRGDLHLHTDRSDGKLPLDALYRLLEARGDSYALLTDHARDCAVAGGLFPGDFRAERRDLERLNARSDGFRMFLGAESNIAEDGSLDITPARVPELDAVVASVHTDLRSSRDQTARLTRAIETPGVAVLGHPRGRLYEHRTGIRADWPRVFASAARHGVAIELNGCPERLDLSPAHARLAAESGCLFSISSDAHAGRHLDFLSYGLAVARAAVIPPDRVVNTFSAERFEGWLQRCRMR